MAQDKPAPRRRLPYVLRIIRTRPRLATSTVFGIAIAVALPSTWWLSTRVLLAWNGGVLLYLALVYIMFARSGSGHIRTRARGQDEGRVAMLVLTVLAATASLGAILAELGSTQGGGRGGTQLALAASTIVLSWIFIQTMFTLHYAHDYY